MVAAEQLENITVANDKVYCLLILAKYCGKTQSCRLCAELLQHRRTPYKTHEKFDFRKDIKWYVCAMTKVKTANDDWASDCF